MRWKKQRSWRVAATFCRATYEAGSGRGDFAETVAKFGRLDALFNNAGRGSRPRTIDETTLEDWHAVLDVNLTGAVLCARAAFAQMRKQSPQGGRIINNGSISAHAPRPGSTPYTVTKHAITGLTKCLSLDGRPFNIAVRPDRYRQCAHRNGVRR